MLSRNAGGAHYLQLCRKNKHPFYFVILIITMLPSNGNSMTSGEGACITHCYGMDVEVDGPKAFAKSAGIFCPRGHSKFLQV